ncbi:MAG TPA: hypothetical protein VJU83_03790 [Burkholderiales bacterium]|nr:hypothetical protein [Burkholderiales bacterium]
MSKYENAKDPGSGHNLNQKQAAQPQGPAKEMVDKVQSEKLTEDMERRAEAEAKDRFPRDESQRRARAGSTEFLPTQD